MTCKQSLYYGEQGHIVCFHVQLNVVNKHDVPLLSPTHNLKNKEMKMSKFSRDHEVGP